jgi:peptidoglycan hydrolase-like protein with peptidoglycan-binding domain
MHTIQHRLAFVAAAAVIVALAGCSSGGSQSSSAPPPAAPAAMTAPPAQSSPPPAMTASKPMSRQDMVQSVQTALNSNGANLTVDGRMGPKTAAALRAYQKQHNLKVTGQPDQATLSALGAG